MDTSSIAPDCEHSPPLPQRSAARPGSHTVRRRRAAEQVPSARREQLGDTCRHMSSLCLQTPVPFPQQQRCKSAPAWVYTISERH
ncbi:hypothetical protein AOLI_G00178130 [Acnodon oligacanthus]